MPETRGIRRMVFQALPSPPSDCSASPQNGPFQRSNFLRMSFLSAFDRRNFPAAPGEPSMFDLPAIQSALREFQFDAWLLCDFRGSNLLARRILDLADRPLTSRRFFYCISARGEPQKLVHRI